MAGNIQNQEDLNVRHFYKGKGAHDTKLSVRTLAELTTLLSDFRQYYSNGDLVWVSEERTHYIIDGVDDISIPTYTPWGGSGGSTGSNANVYYGGAEAIYQWNTYGNPLNKPSTLGYNDGDLVIAEKLQTRYPMFTVFRVSIPGGAFAETFIDEGSFAGQDGADGAPGPTGPSGPKGDSFQEDGRGLYADRPLCSTVPDGYSYLATDLAMIYFAIVPPSGACGWSPGSSFGAGDPGATTYFLFQRLATTPAKPLDNTRNEDVINQGFWKDTAEAGTDTLWMTQTTYQLSNDGAVISGPFEWNIATQVTGEDGLDGQEGQKAGFWVVWTEDKIQPPVPQNKPSINSGTGQDEWIKEAGESWYDDITNDPLQDSPIFMSQTLFTNGAWGPWITNRVGGELPPYTINLFTRRVDAPNDVATNLVYLQPDGTPTSGIDAAIAVNADPAGQPGVTWTDGPTVGTDPLWMIELMMINPGPMNNWTSAVRFDGEEGKNAGIWTIWTNNTTHDVSQIPLGDPNTMIIDDDTINLPAGWTDSSTTDAVWMVSTYYKSNVWTPWNYVRVKGEKGEPGASFSIDSQGNHGWPLVVPPAPFDYCDKDPGWSYFDEATSLLYFKTSNAGASPCTWTSGTVFGKGADGGSSYNVFAGAPTAPQKPGNGLSIDQAIALAAWHDGPPALVAGDRLWISSTSYVDPVTDAVWTTPQPIDGEEGVSSGQWTIWSTQTNPNVPGAVPDITLGDGTLNLTGSGWVDDVGAVSLDPTWMANSYYRPATGVEVGDANGWIWTTWVKSKVKGESGGDGDDGAPAFSYVPSTMFTKLPLNTDIGGFDAEGGCLVGDVTNGFSFFIENDPQGKNIKISTLKYYFEDGIPTASGTERVWMIQGVLNSNDHLCVDQPGNPYIFNWGRATVLKDTAGLDYQYHRGAGSPPAGQGGTKPAEPTGTGSNPDTAGWYDSANEVAANENDGAFWLAQKNWSEGPAAQWVIYKIRGEDGGDAVINTYYSTWHPYNPNNRLTTYSPSQIDDLLGTPESPGTKQDAWMAGKVVDNSFYNDICATELNSYYQIDKQTNGTWIRSLTLRSPVHFDPLYPHKDFKIRQGFSSGDLDYNDAITSGLIRIVRIGDDAKVLAPVDPSFYNVAANDILTLNKYPSAKTSNWLASDGGPVKWKVFVSKNKFTSSAHVCANFQSFGNDLYASLATQATEGTNGVIIPTDGAVVDDVGGTIGFDNSWHWFINYTATSGNVVEGFAAQIAADGTVSNRVGPPFIMGQPC